jgi:Flp pilus assembly protein TadG
MKRTKGQALVEFALILPLLIVLIFAIMDFGYYLFVTISINHATRAGVRKASMNNASCDAVRQIVVNSAVGVVIQKNQVNVSTSAGDATVAGSPPTVTVAVNFDHKMFAPSLWQFQTLPVKSTFKGIVTTYTGKTVIEPSLQTCP